MSAGTPSRLIGFRGVGVVVGRRMWSAVHWPGGGAGGTPLIGRERECDVLRGAVVRVVEGGSAFVLVVGEPGIGKSTLLTALSDLARESGLAVGFGRGQSDGAVPLWPWRSAVASLAAERRAVDGRVQRSAGRPSCRTRCAAPGRRIGTVRDLRADCLAFEHVRGPGPIALLLDDLQWAEVSALRLLCHLVHRPSLPGVLVAGALRTTEPLAPDVDELVAEVLAHPATDVVEVSGFDVCEVTAFAEVSVAASLDRCRDRCPCPSLRWEPIPAR